MTQPISFSKRPVFAAALALFLVVPFLSFTSTPALAQPAAAAGSETCNSERREQLEAAADFSANTQNQRLISTVKQPPASAEITCIENSLPHNAAKGTELFSNNPEFCSNGNCDSELLETISEAQIPTLVMGASSLIGSIRSLDITSIVNVIGNLAGIQLPQNCDGPQLYAESIFTNIDPALTRTAATLAGAGVSLGAIVPGGNPFAANVQPPAQPAAIVSAPIDSGMRPEGVCDLEDQGPSGKVCICGPNTVGKVNDAGTACEVLPTP